MNRVPHGGGEVMVWAGISYRQLTQLHFINDNLNAQRYRDEILRPIVVPFTSLTSRLSMILHGPMSQGSIHNSWKLKMSQFFHGLHTHQTCHPLSMVGMRWIDGPDPANIQQLRTAIEEAWDNITQATINSLINPM